MNLGPAHREWHVVLERSPTKRVPGLSHRRESEGGLRGVGATMAHGGAGEVAPGRVLGGSWRRGSAGRSLGDPSPVQRPGFLLVGGGTTRSWGARNCPPAAPARRAHSPRPERRRAPFGRLRCHNTFRSSAFAGRRGRRMRSGMFPANKKNKEHDVAMAAPRSSRLAVEFFCLSGCRAGSA